MLTSLCRNMEFGLCPWRACVVGMISKACNQSVSCWARQTGNICTCAGPCNQHMGCKADATASEWRHFFPLWFKRNKVNHLTLYLSVCLNYTHMHTCMLRYRSQDKIKNKFMTPILLKEINTHDYTGKYTHKKTDLNTVVIWIPLT